MTCRSCNWTSWKNFLVREMMMWTRKEFDYFHCGDCSTLSLVTDIDDISTYYQNENYYSMNTGKLYYYMFTFLYTIKKIFWIHLNSKFKYSFLADQVDQVQHYIKSTNLSKKDIAILDVWCGNGKFLKVLDLFWYKNLHGVDPYLDSSVNQWNIKIDACSLFDMKNDTKYDIINLSHVLEHMVDHNHVFETLQSKLTDRWIIIVSVPVVSKIFDIYQENRYQIDAPRHTIIYSYEWIKKVFELNWFELKETIWNWSSKQFFFSELYQKDIPLREWRNYKPQIPKFYDRLADEYNKEWTSDQATFVISKK